MDYALWLGGDKFGIQHGHRSVCVCVIKDPFPKPKICKANIVDTWTRKNTEQDCGYARLTQLFLDETNN